MCVLLRYVVYANIDPRTTIDDHIGSLSLINVTQRRPESQVGGALESFIQIYCALRAPYRGYASLQDEAFGVPAARWTVDWSAGLEAPCSLAPNRSFAEVRILAADTSANG